MNHRLPSPLAIRKTVLEGHRWTPAELLSIGVVDELADPSVSSMSQDYVPPVVQKARILAARYAPLAKTGVFGLMKQETSRKIMDAAVLNDRMAFPIDERREARRHFQYKSTISKL